MQNHPLVPVSGAALAAGPFRHARYIIKRPFLSFLGRKFHVFAPDGSLCMFVKHPVLKLKEQFTIYTDESESTPLLHIKARKLIAINVPMDVFDPATNELIGTVRSRGLKSLLRDTWDLLDPNDNTIGLVQEDGLALLRRFMPILPSKHHIEVHDQIVATLHQVFRFFIKEFELDLSNNQGRVDPRLAIASSLLALMAESRREAKD